MKLETKEPGTEAQPELPGWEEEPNEPFSDPNGDEDEDEDEDEEVQLPE